MTPLPENDAGEDPHNWERNPSPFCHATSCIPVFNVSVGHAPQDHWEGGGYMRNISINEDTLRRDLKALLRAQKARFEEEGCPDAPNWLGCL